MNRFKSFQWLPALLVAVVLLGILVFGPNLMNRFAYQSEKLALQQVRSDLRESSFLAGLSETFPKAAEAVRPSVVHISVQRQEDLNQAHSFLRHFDAIPDDRHHRNQDPLFTSAGSGWVYDHDGHLVTNHHVVADAQVIQVRFADGLTQVAELVNSDPTTDVAVLKVKHTRLHPALRSTKPVQQGEIVFAFGSPFAEFDFSMSQGVVSATSRSINATRGGRLQNFIQTDAAINPGNSGGPLTNVYGQVIGMNTAILANTDFSRRPNEQSRQTSTFLGLGFAVPVDMVESVVDQIIQDGQVRHAFLGVVMDSQELSQALAESFGFKGQGVLVISVEPNGVLGPAGQAGLKTGDIITEIAGHVIDSRDTLKAVVATKRPGTVVEVKAWRFDDATQSGQWIHAQVHLIDVANPDELTQRDLQGLQALEQLQTLGLTVESDATKSAITVKQVTPDSMAQWQGILVGDHVTHINGQSVTSVSQLIQAIDNGDWAKGIRIRLAKPIGQTGRMQSSFVVLKVMPSPK